MDLNLVELAITAVVAILVAIVGLATLICLLKAVIKTVVGNACRWI